MAKPTSLLKGFERTVATAKPTPKRQILFDPETPGLALMISPKGKRGFYVVARDESRKQIWKQIGDPNQMTVAEARKAAVDAIQRVKAGEAPVEAPKPPRRIETLDLVADNFIRRHVDKKGLRSKPEIVRLLDKHVRPALGSREFVGIKRSDVAELLDHVEDNSGPREADYVLAVIRKCMNWFAERRDDYVPPLARGMRRTAPESRKRARILSDDEIRALWAASEAGDGNFGAIVRIALLTCQRKGKIAAMRREDVRSGVWHIPAEAREKGTAGELKLPKLAIDLIESQPEIVGNPYVFPGRGEGHFNGWSKCKIALDAQSGVTDWVIHDLRRTGRSLLARAGIRPEIAERVLGHAIAGVEGVYDRHAYRDEKGLALEALGSLLERILKADTGNVVQLTAR